MHKWDKAKCMAFCFVAKLSKNFSVFLHGPLKPRPAISRALGPWLGKSHGNEAGI